MTLPEVSREGNLTYGQAILLEAAAVRINLSGCPELKDRYRGEGRRHSACSRNCAQLG